MSRNEKDDALRALSRMSPPPPRAEARARALAASRAAFEAATAARPETEVPPETAPAPQGGGWGERLRSIVPGLKGRWIMDMRIPLGTVAAAIVIFPLGLSLLNSTSLTQPDAEVRPAPVEIAAQDAEKAEPVPETPQTVAEPPTGLAVRRETFGEQAVPMAEPIIGPLIAAQPPPSPVPGFAAPMAGAPMREAFSSISAVGAAAPPALGDSFSAFSEARVRAVAEAPVSTFAADVDTASYAYVRRLLQDGYMPPADAVRVEEMINYFPYDYASPQSSDLPFSTTLGLYPTPWNPETRLLHIGIQGHESVREEARPSNLVFLIDSSGSMDVPDKLPLLKRAFGLLVEQLSEADTVSIVTYAGSAGVVLEPTPASEKARILSALDRLSAGGSTAGAAGIELAYRLAEENRVEGGVNRVILATDGDFNVGLSDQRGLETYVREKRDSGVFLSVLGFGTGNLRDDIMQTLAQNGNGTASYIGDFREAQKVLVEEIGGTLETIASDVKIQIEFNPAFISEYRLIGYETRALAREDFNNDNVDAGEVGSGHSVTAIYEVSLIGSAGALIDPLRYGAEASAPAAGAEGEDEYAFLRLRYKLPGSAVSQLHERAVTPEVVYADIGSAPLDMRFAAAVAAFGQKLRGSDYLGDFGWADIRALAQGARGEDDAGYRAEFVRLLDLAASIRPDR